MEMTTLIIIWAITAAVLWYIGTLRKKDKINYYLCDALWVLGCIILSPIFLVIAIVKFIWDVLCHGFCGLKEKD